MDEQNSPNKEIAKLLSKYPLYRKLEVEKKWMDVWTLNGQTFNSFCKKDKSIQTFRLRLFPEIVEKNLANQPAIDDSDFEVGPKYSFTQQYRGECSYCGKYHIDFLINGFSKETIPRNNNPSHTHPKCFLRKIGQFPPFEIAPEKEVIEFLIDKDKDFYKKALMNLSTGFGIGAYAYYRRIIENEIKRIIIKVSKLENPNSEEIKAKIENHEKNHQMGKLIDSIYQYLPQSLRELGDNPIKLLYGQLSTGIHEQTEETCLAKAANIDQILRYVIKKLNEEQTEVKAVRDAIKNLR